MEAMNVARRVFRLCSIGLLLLGVLFAGAAVATTPEGHTVIAYGRAGKHLPGWGLVSSLPAGWTADCCDHARWVGVPLVLYRGDWTGKPEGVIVLNVWLAGSKALHADVVEDRGKYLKRDAKATITPLKFGTPKGMACHGLMYRGSDRVDDAVVFCDPGKRTGIHYSWSNSVDQADPARAQLLHAFRQVVADTIYMRYTPGKALPGMQGKP